MKRIALILTMPIIVTRPQWLKIPSIPRKAVFAFLASLLSLAAMVVICEAAIRLTIAIPSRKYGNWAAAGGSELLLVSSPDNIRTVHRYNWLGFRGPEISEERQKKFRIVCIGDSFTEGIGADEEDSWPSVLGKNLPSSSEVLNLGDAGSAPDRYAELLAKVGIPLKPTHCIVCIIPNDLMDGPFVPKNLKVLTTLDDPLRQRSTWFKNWVADAFPGWTLVYDRAQGRRNPRTGIYWDKWGDGRIDQAVGEIVKREGCTPEEARDRCMERLSTLSPECLEAAKAGKYNPARIMVDMFLPNACFKISATSHMGLPENELREKTFKWVEWYSAACRGHQVEPILLLFPDSALVTDKATGPTISDRKPDDLPSMTADHSVSDLLRDACEANDVRFIDAVPMMRQHAGEGLYLRYDCHPNAKGYRIVGEFVAEQLKADLK